MRPGGGGRGPEASGGVRAWVVGGAAEEAAGLVAVVCENERAMEELAEDLRALGMPEERILRLLSKGAERMRAAGGKPSGESEGTRLETLRRLRGWTGRGVLVTTPRALMERVPDPAWTAGAVERVVRGEDKDLEALTMRLAERGYAFEAEVLERGQASRRGGILDVWPPTEAWPLRMEWFGDTVESVRRFDPRSQRSVESLECAEIPPAREDAAGAGGEEGEEGEGTAEVWDYLPEGTGAVWAGVRELLGHFAMSYESGGGRLSEGEESVWQRFTNWRMAAARRLGGGMLDLGGTAREAGDTAFPLRPGMEELDSWGAVEFEGVPDLSSGVIPPDEMERERGKAVERLKRLAGEGWRVEVHFATEAAGRRFEAAYGAGWAAVKVSGLGGGFEAAGEKRAVASEGDLYGTRRGGRARRGGRGTAGRGEGARVEDWTDLRPGELVVHVDHGIGKYLGLYELDSGGKREEVLAVEYAEGARLYVPTGQAHLLTRYVGVGRERPALHKLGGGRWLKEKAAAARAAMDLAAEMLETQAKREQEEGTAFPPDGEWQAEFERFFPYEETADQARAIEEVKRDMESPRPMDRLICGDAGYGKTEVAMRAAFKAVEGGKQVAVLVPTTVLAQQHYETFTARMGRFAVNVDALSRFQTAGERAAALERLASGKTDVMIGTHALLGRGVKFADLGLVVIDEEQRFGVAAKEHLKRMRATVDVLTLSATPIPRTLYLSLTGARDMSLVQTPPQERLAIETYVASDSDELVREAVLREKRRGGQVFFLHNRVQTLAAAAARIEKLVPGIRTAIGHGRMRKEELAEVMHRFVRGDFDVLVSTTIIENGVDIPNVNTILIDRADRIGMASLYQLRGRVGRGRRQAYAYLLLPRHGGLGGAARDRIRAVRKHGSLGAGYKLALKDLEIRGAGNVLGRAQSGHIAAVGFDLYCQLLERTVARLKGEPVKPLAEVELALDFVETSPAPEDEARSAALPRDYVEEEGQRIAIYRKLSGAADEAAVDAAGEELRDRYGELPAPARRLLEVARIRVAAAAAGLRRVATSGERLLQQERGGGFRMPGGRHVRLEARDVDARLAEVLAAVRGGGGR